MRFGVLGPIEVSRDGQTVVVGRGHERSLLAVLMVNANQLISTSQLIDALWERPPSSAKASLHNLISQLRARLRTNAEESPQALIVSHGNGYEFRTDGHELDLLEFRLLVERGRSAGDAGSHDDAFALFAQAVSLWRGPALADLPEEFAVELRRGLHEELLAATKAKLQAGVLVRRYDDVLRDVEDLIVEHPYDERLHEIRMAAMSGLGRRSDALAAYRQVHRGLAEDLGVEPGAALRRLEQQILRGEEVTATPTRARPIPRQLPLAAPVLVGREELIAEVVAALRAPSRQGSSVVVLTGPGGVGKSTVALTAARSAAEVYPDGQLYVDMRGTRACPADTHDVAGRWLRALGTRGEHLPDDRDERIAALRSVVGDRSLLMVLDDVASEEQVRPLLVATGGSATIVTARRHLGALVGAVRRVVPLLSAAEAHRLLAEIVGDDRLAREPEAAAAIAQLCGYLPLAVCVAAARLAVRPDWSLAEVEQRLVEQGDRLNTLAVGDLNVRASIGLSYPTLRTEAQVLIRRLGLIGFADWPRWVAGELIDQSDDGEVEHILDELVDANLVEPLGRDALGQARFRMHGLVSDVAKERAEAEDTEQERSAAVSRVLRAWLALASEADRQLSNPAASSTPLPAPSSTEKTAPRPAPAAARESPLDWLELERINLVEAVVLAARLGWGELAGAIALRLIGMFTMRSYEHELERVLAIAITAVRAEGRHAHLLARLLNGLFAVRAQLDQFPDLPAIAEEELQLARRSADLPSQIRALNNAGRAARLVDRYSEAREWFEQAHALVRQHEVAPTVASRVLAALAVLHIDTGNAVRALPLCEEILRLDQAEGTSRLMAIHLQLFGYALMVSGRTIEARTVLDKALTLATALGDDRGCAWVELTLADLDLRTGHWAAAKRTLVRTIETFERLTDLHGISDAHRLLGDLAIGQGYSAEAVTPLRRCLHIWENDLTGKLERARILARMASAMAASGDTTGADTYRTECLRIVSDLGLNEACLQLPPFVPFPTETATNST
jgi:DNA-binding SARP family transcriptional activator